MGEGAEPLLICLAGAESTGKSSLALVLGDHFGVPVVAEYGRLYCERHGANVSMDELDHIAAVQADDIALAMESAQLAGQALVIADTDAVVTAVWADMMYAERSPALADVLTLPDHYLVTDIDLPWEADEVRVYGDPEERQRFHQLLLAELARRDAPMTLVTGADEARLDAAMAVIEALLAARGTATA